jgi:A/G-specific adenine glycosylase
MIDATMAKKTNDTPGPDGVHLSVEEVTTFRQAICGYYREHGRNLPWRSTTDPYHILVSEIMLQQTQVERVIEKYQAFVDLFPGFEALAQATLRDVLATWQGLGYNRRATALKKIGEIVAHDCGGILPSDLDFLTSLPGLGYNTACAVLAFAFNKPVVFIETNVRTVFMHFFFSDRGEVRDREILPLVEQTLDLENPRDWYSALMDYGTMLKKTHGSINARSAHYQKQPAFKGSDRQIRGMILRVVIAHRDITQGQLVKELQVPAERARKALSALEKEGFVREKEGRYTIA